MKHYERRGELRHPWQVAMEFGLLLAMASPDDHLYPIGGQSSLKRSLLWKNEDERMISKISIGARSAATGCPTPVGLVLLDPLPPLPLPPVQEDLDLFVPRELLQQILPKIGLVLRHNHHVAHRTPPGVIYTATEVASTSVIPAKTGIHKNPGFPRIKYGAGLVKPGMTNQDKACRYVV